MFELCWHVYKTSQRGLYMEYYVMKYIEGSNHRICAPEMAICNCHLLYEKDCLPISLLDK